MLVLYCIDLKVQRVIFYPLMSTAIVFAEMKIPDFLMSVYVLYISDVYNVVSFWGGFKNRKKNKTFLTNEIFYSHK